jgi:hypothetical protein
VRAYQGLLVLYVEQEQPCLLVKVCVANDLLLDALLIRPTEVLREDLLIGVEAVGVFQGSCADHTQRHLRHHFLQAEQIVRPDYQNGSPEELKCSLNLPLFLADRDREGAFNFKEDVQGNSP